MVLCSQTTWGTASENGKQKCFETNKTRLEGEITTAITALQSDTDFQNYVQRGGISLTDGSDPAYNRVQTKIKTVIQKLKAYEDLNTELSEYIKNFINASNPNEITQLQTSLIALQKQIKDAKTDYENAKSRQENIDNPRQHVSNYQGLAGKLGFSKPFHKVSIAIFLALGILLIFLSFMLVREVLNKPDMSINFNVANNVGASSIFQNSLLSLVGIVFLFVLLGLFAYSGKF